MGQIKDHLSRLIYGFEQTFALICADCFGSIRGADAGEHDGEDAGNFGRGQMLFVKQQPE